MRPLKPFAIALGGLIAAVFGAVFFGAPTGAAPAAPTNGLRADLQSKSVAPATDIAVVRDAKPEGKGPPQPYFPFQTFSPGETIRLTRAVLAQRIPGARERLNDQRLQLLIGVVELRI